MVVGRRNLDHVGADDIDLRLAQSPEKGEGLAARKAARDRRAGSRREGRVEAVDIEGAIDGKVADPRPPFVRATKRSGTRRRPG